MEAQEVELKEVGMSEPASTTILDVLNADCWRLILGYLTVNNLVRSECVSRAWQQMVLQQLQGIHNFRIEYACIQYLSRHNWFKKRYANYHIIKLQLNDGTSYKQMIHKMGPFVVTLMDMCLDEERLEAIAVNCPNLKAVTFNTTYRNRPAPLLAVKQCKQLKRMVFDACTLSDDFLSDVITKFTGETLEELEINRSIYVTGSFLTSLRTNLKTLALNTCISLKIRNVQSAIKHLTGLTELQLNEDPNETLQGVHLLLEEMPNLERLCLASYRQLNVGDELVASIGRLSRLRQLHLWRNISVTDEWLAAVARGCPELRTVNISDCLEVSARAVVALCRERPALTELMVAWLSMTDEALETCASCCEGLRILDAAGCRELTENLPMRLSWPRARPLQLRLSLWQRRVLEKKQQVHFEGLILFGIERSDHYTLGYNCGKGVHYVER